MTPRSFAALAITAIVSLAAAVTLYTSSIEWSRASRSGAPLFPGLQHKAPQVAVIEVEQGKEKITLKRDGEQWVLSEHDAFPAAKEKVSALLAGLSRAELVEPKTRKDNRYALLEVEDPTGAEAKSHLVRFLDADGKVLAETIVGRRRPDAFGTGQGGTYVRKTNDEQAWLANAALEAGTELKSWLDPHLFATRAESVRQVEVQMPSEEVLKIQRDTERSGHTLAEIPEGMKLKYVNIVDNIVSAASSLEFEDVRKQSEPSPGEDVSTVAMEVEGGLKVNLRLKRKDDATWMSLEASGDGNVKQVADELMARAKGWEFRLSEGRAKEILKRRDDLLERVSS
jgi:hypothetical protein